MQKAVVIAVVLVVVVVVLASAVFLILPRLEEIQKTTTEFEESSESLIYIDSEGDASCSAVMQLPPSQLSSFMKQIVQLMGVDVLKESYEDSIRGSYARYGLEIENVICDVTGFGSSDNFKVTLTWVMPNMASWSDNVWTINLRWVDEQSAAKEVISQAESNWTLIRSISKSLGIDVAFDRYSYRGVTVLPEGAVNVSSTMFGTYEFTDYGGGSYGEGSVSLGEVDGRAAVIENGVTVTATENEITITPQQLLEEYLAYTVSYEDLSPQNLSFIGSLDQLRLDLKYGRELDDNYPIYSDGEWYSLTPDQLLYYTADAITEINQGNQFSIQQPIKGVAEAGSESGRWEACWKNLSKAGYLNLAQAVLDDINSDNAAPGYIESSVGKMRFRDILYTFTRILSSHGRSGELPSEITFAPVPSGELIWDEYVISADNAYYLLSDQFVITDGAGASAVLDDIRDNFDNRGLVEEICDWTGSNITYGLYFAPPTSEEVFVSRSGQCRDFTNVYLALARAAGIPTRRVGGWIVSEWQPPAGWEFIVTTTPDGKTVGSHAWVQVYLPDEGWIPVEPQSKRPALYVGTQPYEVYRQSEQTWLSALASYETANGLI